jgi:hypothetical protein
MRLKSEIWVSALLRRCSIEGKFGAVIHRGAAEAGIIFVCINHLDGTYDVLGPPPGPAFDEQGERRFQRESLIPMSWPDLSQWLLKRRKNDPDLWAVEIEDREGFAGLTPERNDI